MERSGRAAPKGRAGQRESQTHPTPLSSSAACLLCTGQDENQLSLNPFELQHEQISIGGAE
jgi:hypothetical protein